MRTNARIDELLNKLVSLHLTNGIQPSEVADAAFDPTYDGVEITRRGDVVYMTVSFVDGEDDQCCTRHRMRYVYDRIDRRLMRIEQKVANKQFAVQWDRSEAASTILDEIVSRLRALNDEESVRRFLATVPKEFRGQVSNKLRAVA